MFFTRFEDPIDAGAHAITPSQRLEALKNKISARKEALQNTLQLEVVGENGGGVEAVHPKKRRKLSKKQDKSDVVKSGTVVGISEGKCERRESDRERRNGNSEDGGSLDESQDLAATANTTGETGNGEDISEKKKKKKKKNGEENIGVDQLAGVEPIKPLPDDTIKKRKKKVKKDGSESNASLNNSEPEPKEQGSEGQSYEVETKEKEVAKPQEEWTILGKHKKLQKFGPVKRDLPDWIVNGDIIDTDLTKTTPFSDFGLLDPCIVEVLERMDITSLFPVQSHIIPDILAGCQEISLLSRNFTPPSDICVSAPTGSGKTLVYVLPLVQCLYKLPPMLQAIVVLPTKNLANQVKSVFNHFNKLIKVVLLSGKDTFPTEQKHLFTEQGSCLAHVVVTTPGRIVNHIRDTKLFTLQHLRFLVIDEMDTLLNQTYQDWLPFLFSNVYNPNPYRHPSQPKVVTTRYPPKTRLSLTELTTPALALQKLLFSATVTHDPSKLAPLQLYQPKLYCCGGKYTLPTTLTQYQIRCEIQDKALVLVHLARELGHVLCFTSSVETANRLTLLTEEFEGVKVAEYSSTLTAQHRTKVVRDFDLNRIHLLVCSDSLARGMDLSSVDHVVNYDVPAHVQTYVHRVGRTARAGRQGAAYTLVRHEEVRNFHQLLKKAGDTRAKEMKIPAHIIAELSENYEDHLAKLETKLKSRGRK